MRTLKLAILTLAISLMGALNVSFVPVYAAITPKEDACVALSQINGKGCADSNARVEKLVQTIVTILSTVVGIVSVIMVIVSAFKYITANGDSSNIANAKTTLIYALVGLFIVALAQFIVNYVLSSAT